MTVAAAAAAVAAAAAAAAAVTVTIAAAAFAVAAARTAAASASVVIPLQHYVLSCYNIVVGKNFRKGLSIGYHIALFQKFGCCRSSTLSALDLTHALSMLK